jgi:hypothetical protein
MLNMNKIRPTVQALVRHTGRQTGNIPKTTYVFRGAENM